MKTFNKFLSAALAIIMVITIIPLGSFAQTSGDWEYEQDDSGRWYISGYNGTDTAPVVPSVIDSGTAGDVITIAGIGDSAFSGRDDIESITLPSRLQFIGYYAFEDCSSLVSITIPASVGEIRDLAFDGCSSLESIDVDEYNTSYTSINGVLYDIDMTRLIHYPAAKESTKYTVPDGVETITKYAFRGSNNLNYVYLPDDSLTVIEDGAFLDCTNLLEIEVPSNVYTVGAEAFAGCSALMTVVLPDDLGTLNTSLFSRCANLSDFVLPTYLRTICPFVFAEVRSLSSITIPATVNDIQPGAFNNFFSLEEIDVDNESTYYASDDGVLFNANRTKLVAYPSNKAEESYTVPNTCTSIEENAFQACTNLRYLTIPNTVTNIGVDAFDGCDDLLVVKCSCNSIAATYCQNNGINTSLTHTYKDGVCTNCSNWQNKDKYPTLDTIVNVSTGIKISWKVLLGADKYIVYYYTSSGWKIAGTVDGSKTSFIDTQKTGGQTYKYTVRAFKGDVKSTYDGKGKSIKYLAMPKAQLSNTSTGYVHIEWAKVAGANGYLVYRKAPGATKWTQIANTTALTYDDKNSDYGSTYQYTVKAYYKENSTYTYSAYTAVSIMRLASPSIKLSNTDYGVQIKWDAVKGAKGYYVYRKVKGEKYSLIDTITKNGMLDRTAKPGVTYYYAVKAYNGSYVSGFVGQPIMYLATTAISSAKNVAGGIQVSWGKVGNAKGYIVYRKKSSETAFKQIGTTSSLSYTDLKTAPGTRYVYAVRAYNGSYKGYYDTVMIRRLTNPLNLTLSKASAMGVKITYSKVSGAAGYEIYRKAGNGSYKKIATTTNLSYVDRHLTAGTKYTYSVRAYNDTSYSAYSTKSITR